MKCSNDHLPRIISRALWQLALCQPFDLYDCARLPEHTTLGELGLSDEIALDRLVLRLEFECGLDWGVLRLGSADSLAALFEKTTAHIPQEDY